MSTDIKIVIVDDHLIFTEGLKLLLSKNSTFKVIATCKNGQELLNLLNENKPDIILLDINMPVLNGENTIQEVLKSYPDLRIIILSSDENLSVLQRTLASGAKGFVSKSSCQHELTSAISVVSRGGVHFSQDIFDLLVNGMLKSTSKNQKSSVHITKREKEIIASLCDGKTSKEIALELNINYRTVETHKANILEKIGVKNTISLVAYAIKNNLLDHNTPLQTNKLHRNV